MLASSIRCGERFKVNHFSAMRPLMHIPITASKLLHVVGSIASRDISAGEILTRDMIEGEL